MNDSHFMIIIIEIDVNNLNNQPGRYVEKDKNPKKSVIWTQDLLTISRMLYQLSHWSQVEKKHFIDNVYYLGAGKFSWVSLLKLFHWSINAMYVLSLRLLLLYCTCNAMVKHTTCNYCTIVYCSGMVDMLDMQYYWAGTTVHTVPYYTILFKNWLLRNYWAGNILYYTALYCLLHCTYCTILYYLKLVITQLLSR